MPPGDLHPTFAVQLIKRLHDQSSRVTPALLWLEEHLAARGTTADEIVREVHQSQAAMTVTVRNIITSMRLISEVDWTELIESVSLIDSLLRAGSDFAGMDFATRDSYRIAIEELSRGSGLSEMAITREVLRAAHMVPSGVPAATPDDPISAARHRDPGYFLIGGGRDEFEATIGFRPSILTWLRRVTVGFGIRGYAGSVGLLTLAVTALSVALLADHGLPFLGLIAFALLSLAPAADASVALVNRLMTLWLRPVALPGLALLDGVPDVCANDGRDADFADKS